MVRVTTRGVIICLCWNEYVIATNLSTDIKNYEKFISRDGNKEKKYRYTLQVMKSPTPVM